MSQKKIAIFYHADCLDGFGGAYAAWKKFGDQADYYPSKYGHEPLAEESAGKEAYFIDFCYPKEKMDAVVKSAKSLVVLDHHEGVREVTESMPAYVYDAARSGSTIAWSYFHPEVPVPELLQHMEDEDLYKFNMPDTRRLGVYLSAHDFTFSFWDQVATGLADPQKRKEILDKANAYLEYFNHLVALSVEHAHPVLFEGYTVLLANTSPLKTLKSAVGNELLKKMPPFALVMSVHPNGLGVSIRGDGTVDVSAIARKYGGNGHPSSSGFHIPWQSVMPFTSAEEHPGADPSL
jgi:oligoribonuclease NrnB/cAMP/cGMP phosphodiesterase (DHH superfamily)